MTIKTFRGLLTDSGPGNQDTIRLAGGKLEDGYRIVKLAAMSKDPGTANTEHVLKIYKTLQKIIDNDVDFTDGDLLGVIYIKEADSIQYPSSSVIIFDREIFNQDIYITHEDTHGSLACNYYIELEQVKMGGPEAAAVNFRAALAHGGPND